MWRGWGSWGGGISPEEEHVPGSPPGDTWRGQGGRDQATSHLGLSVQVGRAQAVSELLALPFHKEFRERQAHVPRPGPETPAETLLTPLPTRLGPSERAAGPVLSVALEEAVRAAWRDFISWKTSQRRSACSCSVCKYHRIIGNYPCLEKISHNQLSRQELLEKERNRGSPGHAHLKIQGRWRSSGFISVQFEKPRCLWAMVP